MVPSYALQLAIFLYSKRGARERREVGPACRGARASGRSRRGGSGHGCAAAMVVEPTYAPLPGIGQSEQETNEQRTGDADAILCRIYWKIDNWNR